jgi:hypothetical protein
MWICINSNATLICRFRLDAALYDWPPIHSKGKRGRKATKGKRQKSLKERAADPSTDWITRTVSWYGCESKEVEYFSGESLWYRSGYNPVPLRWVVIRIPETGRVEVICSTDLSLAADAIIGFFVQRWNIEVTFEEVRRHLGVETQRQWSDMAIERSTPCLFGLFSITTLFGIKLWEMGKLDIQRAAWYKKESVTFSDVLGAARLEIIGKMNSKTSIQGGEVANSPPDLIASLMRELASAV